MSRIRQTTADQARVLSSSQDAIQAKFADTRNIRLIRDKRDNSLTAIKLSSSLLERIAHRIAVFFNPDKSVLSRKDAAKYHFKSMAILKRNYVHQGRQLKRLLSRSQDEGTQQKADAYEERVALEVGRFEKTYQMLATLDKVSEIAGFADKTVGEVFGTRAANLNVTLSDAFVLNASGMLKARVDVLNSISKQISLLIGRLEGAGGRPRAVRRLATLLGAYPELAKLQSFDVRIEQFLSQLVHDDSSIGRFASLMEGMADLSKMLQDTAVGAQLESSLSKAQLQLVRRVEGIGSLDTKIPELEKKLRKIQELIARNKRSIKAAVDLEKKTRADFTAADGKLIAELRAAAVPDDMVGPIGEINGATSFKELHRAVTKLSPFVSQYADVLDPKFTEAFTSLTVALAERKNARVDRAHIRGLAAKLARKGETILGGAVDRSLVSDLRNAKTVSAIKALIPRLKPEDQAPITHDLKVVAVAFKAKDESAKKKAVKTLSAHKRELLSTYRKRSVPIDLLANFRAYAKDPDREKFVRLKAGIAGARLERTLASEFADFVSLGEEVFAADNARSPTGVIVAQLKEAHETFQSLLTVPKALLEHHLAKPDIDFKGVPMSVRIRTKVLKAQLDNALRTIEGQKSRGQARQAKLKTQEETVEAHLGQLRKKRTLAEHAARVHDLNRPRELGIIDQVKSVDGAHLKIKQFIAGKGSIDEIEKFIGSVDYVMRMINGKARAKIFTKWYAALAGTRQERANHSSIKSLELQRQQARMDLDQAVKAQSDAEGIASEFYAKFSRSAKAFIGGAGADTSEVNSALALSNMLKKLGEGLVDPGRRIMANIYINMFKTVVEPLQKTASSVKRYNNDLVEIGTALAEKTNALKADPKYERRKQVKELLLPLIQKLTLSRKDALRWDSLAD